MPIRNAPWYDRNASIPYPVDDAASCVDDAGTRLPPDIIVDASLRWPGHLGSYAFLASVTVTPSLLSVTVQSAGDLDDPGFAPLAVLSVPAPVVPGRVYAVAAQADGVGGWLVFGPAAAEPAYRGRFSTPRQSLLTPRAARSYRPFPVTGLGAAGAAAALGGVVLLRAEKPLEIAREEREVEGVLRDCVVVRLVDDAAAAAGDQPTSVLGTLAGPCAGRPESGTCGQPQPVEAVNGVAPDCDGTVTLVFTGCAVPAALAGRCGVALGCGVGLAGACVPPNLPGVDGRLPTDYPLPSVPAPPAPPGGGGESASSVTGGGLPHLECFTGGVAADFSVRAGAWRFTDADDTPAPQCHEDAYAVSHSHSGSLSLSTAYRSGAYETATAATRNVSAWAGADDGTLHRRVTADLKMLAGPAGARHNAAVVFDYREGAASNGQPLYYLAEVDYDAQEFRVGLFNGSAFVPVVPVTVHGLTLDTWYRVTVTTEPAAGGNVTVTATLGGLEAATPAVTVTVDVADFGSGTGLAGVGSDRSLARFGQFSVEEVA